MPYTEQDLPYSGSTPETLETSHEAATTVKPSKAESDRRLILACIRQAGRIGLTDENIQEMTGFSGNTERPRRVELMKLGFIRPLTTYNETLHGFSSKRFTRSGRRATVWVAV